MSRSQLNNLLIGLSLVATGVIYLLQNAGIIGEFSAQTWAYLMAGASVYFLVCYLVTGLQNWGWLFPMFICAGVAGTVWLSALPVNGGLIAAPVLGGVALPFLVIYLLDRKQWWALIPFYVMAVVIGIVLFAEGLPGELIATFVLWSVAFPFLVVYLANRQQGWALIPAGILAGVGLIPLMTTMFRDEMMGGMVLFLIALPFLIVYLLSVKNWWALIPAGVLASIGLGIILLPAISGERARIAMMNGVMYLGWGLTFGVLWLRRAVQPTKWAIYPAIVLIGIGIVAFLVGGDFNQIWPFVIILAGLFLLVRGLIGRK